MTLSEHHNWISNTVQFVFIITAKWTCVDLKFNFKKSARILFQEKAITEIFIVLFANKLTNGFKLNE